MAIHGHVQSSCGYIPRLWTNHRVPRECRYLALLLAATPRTRIDPLLRKLVKVAGLSLRGGAIARKAR